MSGPKRTRSPQSSSPTLSPSTRETSRGTASPASALSLHASPQNPQSLTPSDVIYLQRTVGNRAVNRMLSPMIQRTFDVETVTNDIATGAKRIEKLGGLTEGAYLITTTSEEHPQLVLKATDSLGPVFSAALAHAVDVDTPEILSIPTDGIVKKIKSINPTLGELLESRKLATVQKYMEGTKTLNRQREFSPETLTEIGAIASFDMMTGKQDLFDNVCYQREDNQENFKNILFRGSHAIDIDLGTGGAGFKQQKKIIQSIVENPTEVSEFVTGKVGRLMEHAETGVSTRGSEGLLVQRGMLITVMKTGENAKHLNKILKHRPEGEGYEGIKDMVEFYQELAPLCEGALEKIDVAYKEAVREERERVERYKQEKEEKRQQQELAQQNRQREAAEQSKCCAGCFLTTACVEYKGLADDCEELRVLRVFRDGYMRALPDGETMIREYYAIAPSIVRRIWEDEEYALILEGMYQIVLRCVASIKAGNPQAALESYVQKVLELKEKYLEPVAA